MWILLSAKKTKENFQKFSKKRVKTLDGSCPLVLYSRHEVDWRPIMKSICYEEVKNFSYEEYCSFLKEKYGDVPYKYGKAQNRRPEDGLFIHHIQASSRCVEPLGSEYQLVYRERQKPLAVIIGDM